MNAPSYAAEVYISYAGSDAGEAGPNRDEIVNEIKDRLRQYNLLPKEYKKDVQYKGNLETFMDDIAYGDFIILLVSKKYLESEYCMYEAVGIMNRNKRNLTEKIFPVLLPDAAIFDTDQRIAYVDFWEGKFNKLTAQLAGKDPLKYGGLNDIAKNYREISENIDPFISTLAGMCQLYKHLGSEQQYQHVIDSILQQFEKNRGLPASVQASPALQTQSLEIVPSQVISSNAAKDVAALSKSANNFISQVINKVDDIVLDSEKAKKEFIDINFEEISGDQDILPATLTFIYSLRTEKAKYEPYRQSLIISALSLGLIKKYDETKARLLIDFATDDNPVLSNRALTGVVLGLLTKENYLSNDIIRKLETLKENVKIQRCLLATFFILGNLEELHRLSPVLLNQAYKKMEFFDQKQQWFLPFYAGNPVLDKNIPDKKFASELLNSPIISGLDSTKYAVSLLYESLTDENRQQFSQLVQLEKNMISSIQTEELRSKFLLEIEAAKYMLEFYVYAGINEDAALTDLIEDKKGLRTGYLYKLVLNDIYQHLLKANQYFFQKAYTEAALLLKPVLEEYPNHREALMMYGYSCYYEGNFNAVIPVFEKLKSKGVKEVLMLGMLGDACFNTGDFEKAIQNYELMNSIQPSIPALLNMGRSYDMLAVPDKEKALEYYHQAYALDSNNINTLLFLGDHYYLRYTEPDYSNAFLYYQKAYEQDDSNLNLVKACANCISQLPETPFDTAKQVLEKWISLEPANSYPYLALGDLYANLKPADNLTAFNYYFQAFEKDETNIKLLHWLDGFIGKNDNIPFDKAVRIYNKIIELEPGNQSGYSGLGWLYYMLTPRDFENAFDNYYTAFTLEPSLNYAAFLFQCAAGLKKPDEKKIILLYNKYQELSPGTAKADLAMADYLMFKITPEPAGAGAYYLAALEIEPADKDVLLAAGKYFQDAPAPDYKKAFELLSAYLKQEPEDPIANAHMGWNFLVTGDYTNAKQYFEKSQPKDEWGAIHQNLGHIALIEKDTSTAKKLYAQSYALFKNKDEFYSSSLGDFKFLQSSGLNKDEFDAILKEVVGENAGKKGNE